MSLAKVLFPKTLSSG